MGPNINLTNVDLSNADLSGVDLSNVNLYNSITGPLINFPSNLPSNFHLIYLLIIINR